MEVTILKTTQRRMSCLYLVVVLVSLLATGAPRVLRAQVAGGTIAGTITDSTGAVVPGATITVRSTETNASRELTTNKDGFYQAPDLPAGKYEVTAKGQGFNTEVASNITLTVGARQSVNLTLKIGQSAEIVDVAASAPTVDATTSSVSEVVDSKKIVELPLNGRDWTSLAVLQPGVATVRTQATIGINNTRDNRGLGNQLSIAGNRPEQNNYRLDGISINDYANGAPGSILGVDLGVDSIQEFSVVTGNADASYGKTAGGVLNAITRSGSNSFHGTAFEFIRNSALDARNYFDGPKIPAFKRNQFGGSAGGPIWKDHTFIFGNYEGVRQNLGVTFGPSNVPSPAARQGTLCSKCSTGPVTVAVAPSVAKFLALYPLPTGPLDSTGNTGTYSFVGAQVTSEDFFTIRADHKLSNANTLYGTYLFDNGKTTGPDTLGSKLIGTLSKRQLATIEDTHVFSSVLLNSARFGFSRVVSKAPLTLSALNPLAADTTLGAVPGRAAPVVNVTSLVQYPGGLGSVGEFDYHYNSYQAYDDAFWTRGTHALKFGFAFERMQNNGLGALNPNGNFTFPDLQSFLTNKPSAFSSPLGNGISPRDLRQSVIGAYIQDDWRFRPNLTLNIGLRYEIATVPTESKGKIATLVNVTDAQPRLGNPYFNNPTLKNVAPRVGFGWSPFGNGKTAVRGGFGVYDSLPLLYLFQVQSETDAPFYQTGSSNNSAALAGSFTNGAYPLIAASGALNYLHMEQNPKRNYIMEWNLSVQQEFPGNVTLTTGYVGSHGLHQPGQWDQNLVLPIRTPQGYLGAPAGTPPVNTNSNVAGVNGYLWNGMSRYDGLNVGVKKLLSHGLQVQGSYTWGKAIDEGSATISGDTFLNTLLQLPFYFDPHQRRGLADFNIAQNLVINYLWQIPGPKTTISPVRVLTNGWQLGGIFQASTGTPFTAMVSGDPMGIKNHGGDIYGIANRVTAPGCDSAVSLVRRTGGLPPTYIKTQCFAYPGKYLGNAGRNTLIGPGLRNFDMSLFKNTRIPALSESFNAQFRVEAFNIFNRANFAIPTGSNGGDRVLFAQTGSPDALTYSTNGTAGQISSTTTTARQLQFGLKLIW
jgi:Carboxypeptidase regulatory-like domain/TonB-dependent Receptor Plug Domain